ncbi:MAG: single-stranded DNA-binding protein [Cyanobacteria bacterium P01_H01_bin.121]
MVGRLGRDPEIRYFESGSCICGFTIAVDRNSKEKETDWFDVKLWGKQAQVAADYCRKGSLVGIIGELQQEKWQDRETGKQRSKVVVKSNRLSLLGGKSDSAANTNANVGADAGRWRLLPEGESPTQQPAQQQPTAAPPPDYDNIPF